MKAKRNIYLRVGAGLLALWLGFFGAFSAWQLMRQRDAGLKEYTALFNDRLTEIASYYRYYQDSYRNKDPERMALAVEPEWVIGALAVWQLLMTKSVGEMELACYDANGDLLAQTGAYLTMRYEVPTHVKGRSQPETYFGLLDIYSALPEEAAEKLAYYAGYSDIAVYEHGGEPEVCHLNAYAIAFPGGGWSDGQYVIPRKIVVCEERILSEDQGYFAYPQFDEAGNLTEEGNMPIVWTYEVEPTEGQLEGMVEVQNLTDHSVVPLPAVNAEYPEYKTRVLDEFWSRKAKGRAGLEEWGFEDGFFVEAPGDIFLSARGLLTTEFIAEGSDYNGQVLLVAAGAYHTLKESAKTLGAAAAGSGVLLMMVGLILCWQLGRVYEAQAALEAQRRRTTNAIAHDLKTPMAAVMAYAENLLEDTQPQKRDHYLRAIHSQVGRMDEIVRRMLELSRLEAGADQLCRTEFSLGELCRQAAEDQPGLVLVNGDAEISADREMLRRVLDNLLSNALRHAAPDTAVTVTIESGCLEVCNVGEPIPEDKLGRLWEPYYQADEARSAGGSGLGLSIVREILLRHGFSYGAENRGDTVVFWFRWT